MVVHASSPLFFTAARATARRGEVPLNEQAPKLAPWNAMAAQSRFYGVVMGPSPASAARSLSRESLKPEWRASQNDGSSDDVVDGRKANPLPLSFLNRFFRDVNRQKRDFNLVLNRSSLVFPRFAYTKRVGLRARCPW